LESIKDAVIVRTLSGKIFYVNKAAEILFGFSPDELIGRDVKIIIPASKENEEKSLVESILWGEKVENYETERIDKDNHTIHVSVSLSPMKDEEGKIIGITKVIRNITEAKRSEGKFQALLESAPDAMVIVNKFGQIVLVNAQTEKLFGFERSSLIGQEVEMLIPKRFKKHHPDHRKKYFGDPKMREMGAELELYGVRSDKTEFPVEISLSPLKFAEGMFVSAAIRDITKRKKSEAKFKGLLESAPDAMVIVNQEGKIQLINAQTEKLFGYSRADIIGERVEILIPDRFKGVHPHHREGFFSSPRTRSMGAGLELYGKKMDGTEFPVEISLSPIETEEGLLVSAAIRDITDQKNAAIALKEYATRLEISNKELEQFAYVASHDLQEPLRNITNYVSLLEKGSLNNIDEDTQRYLGVVMRSADRMKTLIRELLNFSRIGRNRVIESVDVNTVVSDVITDLNLIIVETKAKIKTVKLPVVQANSTELKQLFQNLLINAMKFKSTERNPNIEINCEDKEDDWQFSVSDNGLGIADEHLPKIFLIFQRLHSEKEYPGTGIGLATCKKIVELNDGQIWVESELSKGSTFYFTLPKQ